MIFICVTFSRFLYCPRRDIMIQQLMAEVTRLKEELAHVQGENQMMQESLHNRIHELEQELGELRQIAESTQQVAIS